MRSTYRYLERYATSQANLYFILNRKVDKILNAYEDDREEIEQIRTQAALWINEIIEKCIKNELINDRLYARGRANSLIQSANSLSNIKNKLRSKGVAVEIIDEVLDEIYQEKPNINILSAIKYIKKRRFGSFRIKEREENTQQKELAAMARAGFSYADSIKILKLSRQELEDALYGN